MPRKKKLNREAFLQIKPTAYARKLEVKIPEWGGSVFLKELSARQQQEIYGMQDEQNPSENMELVMKALVWCCVDEDGEFMFHEKDIPLLMEHSGSIVVRLMNAITELNEQNLDAVKKN